MKNSTEWVKGIEEKLEAKRQKQMLLNRKRKEFLSTAAAFAMMFCVIAAVPESLREINPEESAPILESGSENRGGEEGTKESSDHKMKKKGQENPDNGLSKGTQENHEEKEDTEEKEEETPDGRTEESSNKTENEEEDSSLENRTSDGIQEPENSDKTEVWQQEPDSFQEDTMFDPETEREKNESQNGMEENPPTDRLVESEETIKQAQQKMDEEDLDQTQKKSETSLQTDTAQISEDTVVSKNENQMETLPSAKQEAALFPKGETVSANNSKEIKEEYDRILWMGREYIRTGKTVSTGKSQGVIGFVDKKYKKKKFRELLASNEISSKIKATNLEKGTKIYQIKGRKTEKYLAVKEKKQMILYKNKNNY